MMFVRHSPFADKLETNYVPSDAELDEIRTLLEDPLDELARLNSQIDEMQSILNQLRVKRRSLKNEIDSYEALTSPIRRIPQDILQEIFLSCLLTKGHAEIDIREAPLLLGYPSGLDFDGRLDAGLEPVINASRRMQHLELYGAVIPPILALDAEDLPVLISLRTRTWSNLDDTNIFKVPSLRHVSLAVSTDPLSLPIIWEQLTNLRIGRLGGGLGRGLDFNGAFEVLVRCKHLVHCRLELVGSESTGFIATPASTLTCLQSLTLIFEATTSSPPAEFIDPYLTFVISPSCTRDVETTASPPIDMQHFCVQLSLLYFTPTCLLHFLDLLPRLTQLRLLGFTRKKLDDIFLSRLTPTQASRHLCPLLTHLEIGLPCSTFSYAAVLNFILARSRHGSPLQQVKIVFIRDPEFDIVAELQPDILEGLAIELIY
ncbi:hypothetical protein FB451DRAFT_1447355 [Mycena latifolia]|nr:hypothetical protein FB451DRAFT_1447355 [Mycena latifolia]